MTSIDTTTTSKAIMIVDDESDIVLIFRRSLELAGYNVFAFTDAIEALEHLKLYMDKYGLIISDARMPNMTGLEFATKVRGINASIPFILMSAFDLATQDISPALSIAMFLQKPVMPSQLKQIVSRYISIPAR
jgi:two-component system C4-dicarboxylate transport response regulator DctD